MELTIGNVVGLPADLQIKLNNLVDVFNYHQTKNIQKEEYYEGYIGLSKVNLGIALPQQIQNLEIKCGWAEKTVDVLASRSMFDGYVSSNGEEITKLNLIVQKNHLISQYIKACKDELKFGCTFATLSADKKIGCKIRFHTPATAAALWNGEKERIDYGMAIIDTVSDEKDSNAWQPSKINLYTDSDIWVLTRNQYNWSAKRFPHKMGRPLMVPMIWNATHKKPFGRSRIKNPERTLIDEYIRTLANAAIALEFATTPQKYLLGITDDQYDAVVSDKFKQYVGAIIAATNNPETGTPPIFGQLPQGTLQPHIEMLRIIATQFAAKTGLTVVDIGIINDANPSSSDAILAQSQTLVSLAEQLNSGNGDALNLIAQMAQAITRNVALDDLDENEQDVIAHFKNPAMPSVSVTADAAIKIASARKEFASTDTFLEMVGFSQADIRRIKAQEQRARGQQLLTEMEQEQDTEEVNYDNIN